MVACAVFGCNSNSSKAKAGEYSFYKLPSDKTLASQWKHFCKRTNLPKDDDFRICHLHFIQECFERDLKYELLPEHVRGKKKRSLLPGVLPTIFDSKVISETVSTSGINRKRRYSNNTLSKVKKSSVTQAICDYETSRTATKETQTESNVKSISSQTPKSKKVSRSVQTSCEHETIGTQTSSDLDTLGEGNEMLENSFNESHVEDVDMNESILSRNENDPDFLPSSDEEDSSDDFSDPDEKNTKGNPEMSSAFIVFWSCLLNLLRRCLVCPASAFIENIFYKGSMISVMLVCEKGHSETWHSHPIINGMALGNLRLACGIVLSGLTFQGVREALDFSQIKGLSSTTFYRIQRKILQPVINEFWSKNNHKVIANAKLQGNVEVCGDGQCDSPGYNAKYGIYSMLNKLTGEVLAFRVVQVSEAGNSNNMEKFGLIETLKFMKSSGVLVTQLTIDRHVSCRKYIITHEKEIELQFDIWHVGKSVKKKLTKLAKKKPCAILGEWIKSIVNHLWWCSATCQGDVEILKEKWTSVLYHITDRHEFPHNKKYTKCCHEPYPKGVTRKWLKLDTPAYDALSTVINKLCRDLPFMTKFSHNGGNEVYHSVRNKYAPKRLHFSYEGLVMRSQLAVLDVNNNVNLAHAKTRDGNERYKLSFTKITGTWVVKPIKEKKSKTTFHSIVQRCEIVRANNETLPSILKPKLPSNIAPCEKPKKEDAIKHHRSRFSHS